MLGIVLGFCGMRNRRVTVQRAQVVVLVKAPAVMMQAAADRGS